MESKRLYLLTAMIIVGLFSVVWAEAEKRPAALDNPVLQQQNPAQPVPAPQAVEVNEPNVVKFPYVGEVTGSEINVRSGPGMNFYSCGKINAPARVVVVDQKYSWSKILPPPGSFSWIFRQYVQTDPNNPGTGTVNSDNVRVYAGSEELEPMRSDSVQISLASGQKVRIIGQPVGDYYKIAPPEGSALWTTSQYIKYVRSADEIDVKIPRTKDVNTAKPTVIVEQVETKSRQLEQYYTLQKLAEDEKNKPLEQQDYTKIKPEVEKLIGDPNSGNAGDYAKYLLKDIIRCEVAKEAQILLESQKTELQQTITKVEKERQEKLQTISDISKYAIMGTFKKSIIYEDQPGSQRFLVVDDNNKPVSYAEPVGDIKNADFKEYFGQKVGLIGTISVDEQSHLSLIKFEKIERLEKTAPQPQKTPEPNEEPNMPGEPNEPNEPNSPVDA